MFNSVVGVFSSDFAHNGRTWHIAEQKSWDLVIYKSMGVKAVRKPEVAGLKPAVVLV